MIPAIQHYIQEHIDSWLVEVGQPPHLRPLLRSNANYNYVENYSRITRVVLWFSEDSKYPVIVSKIMDESMGLESIKRCITIQEGLNEKVGYPLFPRIYDIAQISGSTVLFEEAVRCATYETEIKGAIGGPERSLARLERVMRRQFEEMGGLFKKLQDMPSSDKPRQWGDWAYQLGQDFRKTCGFDASCLTDARLDNMRAAIDTYPLYQYPVLGDLASQNTFYGPRLIDNINPDIDELNAQLPGVINALWFIILYFSDLMGVFEDWLYAIAVAITDREGQTIIGPPVRDILRQVGLDPDQPDIIWAFVMAATLLEMKDKLEFYGDSPFVTGVMKNEFQQRVSRMIEIQESIKRDKRFDIRPIIRAQDSLQKEKAAPSFNPERIMLNLVPPFIRPRVVKLYSALYPRLRGVSYLRKMRRYLVNRLLYTGN